MVRLRRISSWWCPAAGVGQVDDGPVVEAVALRAASCRQLLPGPLRHLRGQGVGAELPAAGGDFGRAGHRQDVADAAFLQRGPQLRVAAVDLVAGDPADAVSGVQEPFDHRARPAPAWSRRRSPCPAGGPAAVGVAGPGTRDIQLPVHRRVPRAAGVDEVDGDLGVLDPPGRAGVLALDPDGVGALLHVAGLVDHQHRLLVVRGARRRTRAHRRGRRRHPTTARPSRCCMPSGVASPAHSAIVQQFLRGRSDSSPSTNRPARRRGSTRANRPAIRPIRPLERLLPAGRVYAVTCGHRLIVSLHNTDDQRWPHPSPHRPHQQDHDLQAAFPTDCSRAELSRPERAHWPLDAAYLSLELAERPRAGL